MIYGEVNQDREALLDIVVVGADGYELPLQVIVDTGFSAFLTLPRSLIGRLGLSPYSTESIRLGDGSIVNATTYRALARVLHDSNPIIVQHSEGDILGGMALFDGMLITVEAVIGGQVTISPLE